MKCEDGKLPTAWTIKPLGTICEVVRGGSPRPIMNYLTTSPTGVNWLKIGDVGETDKYFTRAAERIKLEGTTKSRKVERGDLLLSNSMSFGRAFITLIDGYIHDGWLRLRSDERVLDKEYLYYFLLSPFAQNQFKSVATGSVVANLKSETVKALEVLLPPLPEQKRIAAILSSLDDKIELNNKINANLEQQAQALFKAWFVDFEPFGGKMPEDWRRGTIADLGTVVGGSTPSKAKAEYYTMDGIAWITPKDLSLDKSKFIYRGENDITELGLRSCSASIMPEGTVLFSSRAPIGYIAIAAGEVTTNQGFKSVVPNPEIGTAFVYYFLNFNLSVIEGMASGSTFKEVSGSTMKRVPALIPDAGILSEFNARCGAIFAQQRALEAQNRALSALRDELLPVLMSGEIAVAENRMDGCF